MIIINLIRLLISLAIPVGIIVGIVMLVRRSQSSNTGAGRQNAPSVPGTAERIFTYTLSFAGFMAVLFGLATLLALAFIPIIPDASALISADDIRIRVSYSLAALIVGAPFWLGLWRHAQKRVAANGVERNTVQRRLYLAAIFGTTSIVAVFGAQELLSALIALIGNADRGPHIRDAVTGGSLLAVYGVAWLGYARLGWSERAPSANDRTHDLALYALTGTALAFLFFGLGNMLHQLLTQAQGSGSLLDAPGGWSDWSGPIASTLAGGAAWWSAQVYDRQRGNPRILRVVYLYCVILFIAPLTVYNASSLLYELVRRTFGYSAGGWNFLADALPWLLVGVAFWAYHWMLMHGQTSQSASIGTDADASGAAGIPYPRRPALAIYTAAGTVMAAVGAAIPIWIGIDALLDTHATLSGGAWWRDELSTGITLLLIGSLLWLPAWTFLQRAAMLNPDAEGNTTERRWLLAILSLGGALTALGFTIALLYGLLRAVLGEGTASTLSDSLHFGSTALVALAVAGYYGLLLRTTMWQRSTTPAPTRVRLTVLLAPGSSAALNALLHDGVYQVNVIGAITAEEIGPCSDLQTLQSTLALLDTAGHPERALLILGPTGGHLYPYAPGDSSDPVVQSPEPDSSRSASRAESWVS